MEISESHEYYNERIRNSEANGVSFFMDFRKSILSGPPGSVAWRSWPSSHPQHHHMVVYSHDLNEAISPTRSEVMLKRTLQVRRAQWVWTPHGFYCTPFHASSARKTQQSPATKERGNDRKGSTYIQKLLTTVW